MITETLDVTSQADWRDWLGKNGETKEGIWLVFYKKDSEHSTIAYDDAVDEALAYGWIDSVIRRIDEKRFARKFTPRRLGSVWSKYNLARVKKLNAEGRMTKRGLEAYARRTGETSLLEQFSTKAVRTPSDLMGALRRNERAWSNYRRFGQSHRKRYLMWISSAKKPETRKKRIAEAVKLIAQDEKNLLK